MRIVVTGGAGFIGSNFLNRSVARFPEHQFINVDKLTYAANLSNLTSISKLPNYRFERLDISDHKAVFDLFERTSPDLVVNFAAESHVDRSILGPLPFVHTNILGTCNLLEACRMFWRESEGKLFHHVSTDEVFGSLGDTGHFNEETRYDPHSPYSASKAASDHLVRAYHTTYGLPIKITNCSNNYGPYQFPEKLIPLVILNAFARKPLPVYGKGANVRDWLFVEDHCDAIWTVIERGEIGETYNVGGRSERKNIDVVRAVCHLVAELDKVPSSEVESLITFVADRPGHDHRYAIDATKIESRLGWSPRCTFELGLRTTIEWYRKNSAWVEQIRSGEYTDWLAHQYGDLRGVTVE